MSTHVMIILMYKEQIHVLSNILVVLFSFQGAIRLSLFELVDSFTITRMNRACQGLFKLSFVLLSVA